jgi:flagellar motor switch protein FliG
MEMSTLTTNLRKAAILIRSLDADTAAKLLGQLSPAEAKSLRLAIQALGPVEADERADVAAEFRRVSPVTAEDPRAGVELDLSSGGSAVNDVAMPARQSTTKPFDFLEHARIESLVPYLAREQSQTIAVVLSYLAPDRAALVLAALPARLQSETIERLSAQGDTDPAALHVLERELAAWLSRQQSTRTRAVRRTDTVAAILAAADESTRGSILTNLAKHNRELAEEVSPRMTVKPQENTPNVAARSPQPPHLAAIESIHTPARIAAAVPTSPTQRPRIKFDDLARLDQAALAAVLRTVESEVLVLALVGADEELIDRIATQMPRPIAKTFRQRLRQMGPTRLRDVAAAQQDVAEVAAKILQIRRRASLALTA